MHADIVPQPITATQLYNLLKQRKQAEFQQRQDQERAEREAEQQTQLQSALHFAPGLSHIGCWLLWCTGSTSSGTAAVRVFMGLDQASHGHTGVQALSVACQRSAVPMCSWMSCSSPYILAELGALEAAPPSRRVLCRFAARAHEGRPSEG